MDSLNKALEIKADQGRHEMEVSFGGEADLHKSYIMCDKNPGHNKFIPITKFAMHDLPACYHDDDVYKCIKAWADLTVRVSARHISASRPKTFPGADGSPYPFYNFRGKSFVRVGTGWIGGGFKKFTEKDNMTCPCPDCKESSSPSKEWGQMYVHTATHVVYDTEEAQKTTRDLFYDSDDQAEAERVQNLTGVEVRNSDVEKDWCEIVCITHDLDLWDKLFSLRERHRALNATVEHKYWQERDEDKVTVIASHPHGCVKQISIGEWTDRKTVKDGRWTQYTYTTSTCPGSSGAPVYVLGRKRGMCTTHPHSGRAGDHGQLNQSGGGEDW